MTGTRLDAFRWVICVHVPPRVGRDQAFVFFRLLRLGDRVPRVRASRIALQLEAIRAGAGLGILPCFVGDADPSLLRLTPPIEELAADYWLLVHPDL